MRRKILLATTECRPSAARLAGAFAMLGAGVEAVFPRRNVLRVCRYLDRAFFYQPRHGRESFAEAIRRSAPDLVVPCDARALALLLDLAEFAPLLERSFGALEAMPVLMSGAASITAARRAGVAAPPTLGVGDADALPHALAEVGLPCMMKTDRGGAVVVGSHKEAERAFRKLHRPPSRARCIWRAIVRNDAHFLREAHQAASVSVQGLIGGKPATTVFAARRGAILSALHLDLADERPGLAHRIDSPAMDAAAAAIAARFDLSGLHGLDYVRDHEGVPHLTAVHPFAGDVCHLALGPDLPAALLGVPARPAVTTGRAVALFPKILNAPELPRSVYRDIPWDDPAVLRAASGDALPEAQGLELIPEFVRPASGPPVYRRESAGQPIA